MIKVSFDFLGLTLLEPLSSLMNWVLAAQCFFFYLKLSRTKTDTSTFHKYWTWFFLCYAISLVFGGFSHLLYHYVGMSGKIPGWSIALLGVTAAEWAMVSVSTNESKRRTMAALIQAKLFASVALLIYDFDFKWVMAHTGGMILIIGIYSMKRWRNGQSAYRFFMYGIACLIVMAIVKISGFDIHPEWLTRDDISHFIMLVLYWMFYRAVIQVSERPSIAG